MSEKSKDDVVEVTETVTETVADPVTDTVETVETVETEAAEVVDVAPDAYSKEELTSLTKALGAVVFGASMSEKSGAFGIMREIMAAMRASAVYVGDSSNALLKQIVTDVDPSDVDDAEKQSKANPQESAEKAVNDGIAAAKSSHDAIVAKGNAEDADAWAQLLLTASNAAVQATKTGGFLGFGGEKVTASEQEYMSRLADTLGYKKEGA